MIFTPFYIKIRTYIRVFGRFDMLYEVRGTYEYPDLPTENLVDVPLYFSGNLLISCEFNNERPVFNAADLEEFALQIMNELQEMERELQRNSKRKISEFILSNQKYLSYIEDNKQNSNNRIFTSFLEDVHNQFLLVLGLFSYKDYPLVLDDRFRQHFFEYRFISYLTTYFYYESVQYDKKIRKRNEKEITTLDSPIEDGITLKDTIAAKEELYANKGSFKDLLTNDLLVQSFKKLSSQQQEVLNYYYVQGYKEKEISEVLGISQQAVSKSKRKAIDKLKVLMVGGER